MLLLLKRGYQSDACKTSYLLCCSSKWGVHFAAGNRREWFFQTRRSSSTLLESLVFAAR